MSEYDVVYCRPLRSYKAKRIFELSYNQNDFLTVKIQKGLSFHHVKQNYKWLEAVNECTKKSGYVSLDAIEIDTISNPNLPGPAGNNDNKSLVGYSQQSRKISLPQKHSELDLEDTYVQFLGCDAVDVKGTNAAYNGHNLVNTFFLTPILCIHCKDYIWGRGRQGVSCSGIYKIKQKQKSATK